MILSFVWFLRLFLFEWVQIFFGDAFQRLHFADAEVVFALGHQSAGQADTVAPAQALRLVQQLCAARKADGEAKAGVDLHQGKRSSTARPA